MNRSTGPSSAMGPVLGEELEEEETLEKYFRPGKFNADTSQLNEACLVVKQFIAQECGNLANTSGMDQLCRCFHYMVMTIFGVQDAAAAASAGNGSGSDGGLGESSWMFAATSFYSVDDNLSGQAHRPMNRGSSLDRLPVKDLRSCCMDPRGKQLLSLLLAMPTDYSASKNLFGLLTMFPSSAMALQQMVPYGGGGAGMGGAAGPEHDFGAAGIGGATSSLLNTKTGLKLQLSMLEYYLFSFAWYALSSQVDFYHHYGGGPGRLPPHQYRTRNISRRPERVALAWRRFGVRGLVHKNPYMALLKDYVECFFPHGSGAGCMDSLAGMDRNCELFLRVLVEFWLEGNAVLHPGFPKEVAEQYADALSSPYGLHQNWINHNNHYHHNTAVPGLPHPVRGHVPTAQLPTVQCDPVTAEIANEYAPPTDMALHGLLVVSAHLLSDPRLVDACARVTSSAATVTNMGGGGGGGRGGRGGTFPAQGGGNGSPITPALELLRPHVFSFLRAAFSPASSIETGSTVFTLTVELWLLWMRPWASPSILEGRSPRPVPRHGRAHAGHDGGGDGGGGAEGRRGASTFWRGGIGVGGMLGLGGMLTAWVGSGHGNPQSSGGLSHRRSVSGIGGASARNGAREYRPDPWSAWVLENYSLYSTLLVAFVRKTMDMSLKVPCARDTGSGGNDLAAEVPSLLTGTGRANLDLLWRISEAFCDDVTTLILRCQTSAAGPAQETGPSRYQPRSHGALDASGSTVGGDGGNISGGRDGDAGWDGGRLSSGEAMLLESGREAVCAIQGPQLVALAYYQEPAMELLASVAELAYPSAPRGRVKKMMKQFSRAEGDEGKRRAHAVFSKLAKLFGVPSHWRPKGYAEPDVAGGANGLSVVFKPERDKNAPSFLSNEGQAQLASGRRVCKPWDVSYVGDPMYRPLRAWETELLVQFWVGLSEKFNDRWLGWASPQLDDDGDLDEGSYEDEGPSRAIAVAKDFQRKLARGGRWASLPRRLNLRPLADLRATLGLLVALYILMQAWSLNSTVGMSLTTLFACLCIRISTMELV